MGKRLRSDEYDKNWFFVGFGLRPKLDGDANAQEMAIPTRLYSDMATATSDQPSIERLRIDQHMKEQRESVFNCLILTAIAWEQLFLGFFFSFSGSFYKGLSRQRPFTKGTSHYLAATPPEIVVFLRGSKGDDDLSF